MSGKPVPVRLSEATLAALDARAEREGCSRSALIVRVIEASLAGDAQVAPVVVEKPKAQAPQVEKVTPQATPKPAVAQQPAAPQRQAPGAGKPGEVTPYGVRGADGLTDRQRAMRQLKTSQPDPPPYGARLKRKPGRGF